MIIVITDVTFYDLKLPQIPYTSLYNIYIHCFNMLLTMSGNSVAYSEWDGL